MTGHIENAIHDIAADEVTLWRHYNQKGHFPPIQEDHFNADLGFSVFRTPYGTVYHATRSCTQLQGLRTGHAREFQWCELCSEVGMRTRGRPIPGSPLQLLTTGQTLHTDPRCPRNQSARKFRGCLFCTKFPGKGSLSIGSWMTADESSKGEC